MHITYEAKGKHLGSNSASNKSEPILAVAEEHVLEGPGHSRHGVPVVSSCCFEGSSNNVSCEHFEANSLPLHCSFSHFLKPYRRCSWIRK